MYSTAVSFVAALVAFAPTIVAQTTTSSATMQVTPAPGSGNIMGVSPEQSSRFSTALESYYQSFLSGPQVSGIGLNLVLAGKGSLIGTITATPSTLIPFPTTNFDLSSFATNPPSSFSMLAWESELPTDIRSSIESIRTSAVFEAATIAQSVIGVTSSLSVPQPPSTGAAPRATGMPGGNAVGLGIVGAVVGAGAAFL